MEIRVLRYFLTVAREEKITRAAELLHLTQPTLSRQLAALEEELGTPLFVRGPRKLTLTEEGMLLRRRAEEILELVDKTGQELHRQQEALEGTVTVGSGEIASMDALAPLCLEFQRLHPRVQFDFFTATADVVVERMERGLVDIGLLLEPVDVEKYDYIRLQTHERWALLLPAQDPLARKECFTARDLAGLPLGLPARVSTRSELASWFGKDFQNLNITFSANLPGNAAVMVQQGMGYYIAVEGAFRQMDPARLVTRPLSPSLTAATVLAWKRGQPAGRAAAQFAGFAAAQLRRPAEPSNIGP